MLSDEIKQYLSKVCKVLNAHEVEYIVVGGAAVNYHGLYRPSGIGSYADQFKTDLDFWYSPTISNYEKLIAALGELDVDTTDLKRLVFDKNTTFLKIPHKDFHTDFLPVMAGLDSFRLSGKRAEVIDIDGMTVRVLSYDDLLENKRAVNRKIDQSDIEGLKALKRKKKGRGI
jgi:predicted nucleotidyltransferase